MRENNRLNSEIHEKVSECEKLHIKLNNLESKLSDKQGENQRVRNTLDLKEQEVNEMRV